MKKLHWLTVSSRIKYNLLVTTHITYNQYAFIFSCTNTGTYSREKLKKLPFTST